MNQPTNQPASQPASQPTNQQASQPGSQPTNQPANRAPAPVKTEGKKQRLISQHGNWVSPVAYVKLAAAIHRPIHLGVIFRGPPQNGLPFALKACRGGIFKNKTHPFRSSPAGWRAGRASAPCPGSRASHHSLARRIAGQGGSCIGKRTAPWRVKLKAGFMGLVV